jgi:sulfotransferase family protein
MEKVNLFVVGGMRCGTTSFSEMLNSHQDIYVPPIKEPHYFSDPLPKAFLDRSRFFSVSGYFKNTFPKPLHSAQIFEERHYKKLYSLATHQKYLVDASTSYLHEPGAAERIKEYNPSAKIIILTRDPLERAFSHYRMDVGLGRITKSFEKIILEEIQLYINGNLPWYSHLGMSFYKMQINRFRDLFDDVLILTLERLIQDVPKEMERVSSFLGIDKFTTPDFPHKNPSINIKSPKILYSIKKTGIKECLIPVLGKRGKNYFLRIFSKKTSDDVAIPMELKKELEIFFGKDII